MPPPARHVIAILRRHEAGLRPAGIRHLSIFGSTARGDADADGDVHLAAELDPEARIGLFALGALERRLAEMVGCRVDLVAERVEAQRLRARIDQDRRRAFPGSNPPTSRVRPVGAPRSRQVRCLIMAGSRMSIPGKTTRSPSAH